ncbi:MAG: hypothetical protein P4M15_03780 [Alphaproteobacteria bacterium]|nr:hypothetical protein [Alphaproteobacteria bacterium]
MINIRETRFWTAMVVAGLSLLTIGLALPTLRFGQAGLAADPPMEAARLKPLLNEAPVAALAQQRALALAPHPPSEQVAALTNLLTLTPMSSGAWLELAIAGNQTGQPMQAVASALAMSTLTGPNEARFMAGRAVFGLPLWDKLPPEVRRSLVVDLVSGWGEIGEEQHRDLDALLTVASDKTRAQLLAALLLAGKKGEAIGNALDLAANQPAPINEAPKP